MGVLLSDFHNYFISSGLFKLTVGGYSVCCVARIVLHACQGCDTTNTSYILRGRALATAESAARQGNTSKDANLLKSTLQGNYTTVVWVGRARAFHASVSTAVLRACKVPACATRRSIRTFRAMTA